MLKLLFTVRLVCCTLHQERMRVSCEAISNRRVSQRTINTLFTNKNRLNSIDRVHTTLRILEWRKQKAMQVKHFVSNLNTEANQGNDARILNLWLLESLDFFHLLMQLFSTSGLRKSFLGVHKRLHKIDLAKNN